MPFCTSCGNELETGMKYCNSCGKQINPKTEPSKKETQKTANDEYTPEGRKIIKGGPKPVQNNRQAQTRKSSPPEKKKKGFLGCFIVVLVIAVLLIVGGVKLFDFAKNLYHETFSGDEKPLTENSATSEGGMLSIPEKKTKTTFSKKKALKSEFKQLNIDNTVAKFDQVSIDFGDFNIDEPKKLKLDEYPEEILNGECKINSYDISLENQHKFNDYLTISLPYDDQFIQQGKAEDCVAAQYFNQRTNEWEPVLFDLDTKNKKVIIHTDHLSRYGVFTVKNDKKRHAYVKGFYIPDRYFSSDKEDMHIDILDQYYSGGQSLGEKALSKGLGFWSEFSGHSGAAINTLTLGGVYATKFIDKLNDGFKNTGYVTSTIQLAYDLWRGDQKTAAINLVKNIINQTVAELNISSLNLAFVGVYFIDYSLTKFGNAAMASRYEELFKVYNYYNRNYNSHRRSLKEWRRFFIQTELEYQKNPEFASNLIMEEIDAYSREFIDKVRLGDENENTVEFNALAGEAGVKSISWPNSGDVIRIQQEGKQQLIDRLYPVFTSLNNYRIKKMKEELIKECTEIQKMMNTIVPFTIMEDLDPGEKAEFANHIVCLRPLDEEANVRQWTGRLNNRGYLKTSFSIIGYVLAGEPNTVEIYHPEDIPDDDAPVFEKEFIVDPSGIIVYLTDDEPEVEVGAIKVFHEHTQKDALISKYGVNDPLEVMRRIKDIQINIGKNGKFTKTINGQTFKISFDDRKAFNSNDGILFQAGNIGLTGQIDDMEALHKHIESKTSGNLKIGTMTYRSNGSFSEKETIKGVAQGGGDFVNTLQDYTFSVQAKYDLFLERDVSSMETPYAIRAITEKGKRQFQGSKSHQSTFSDSFILGRVVVK